MTVEPTGASKLLPTCIKPPISRRVAPVIIGIGGDTGGVSTVLCARMRQKVHDVHARTVDGNPAPLTSVSRIWPASPLTLLGPVLS